MADQIRLRLVTPRRLLLDEEVDEVTAPGALGEFGVLPDHISFLSALDIGELSYKRASSRVHLALSGGYAEILDNEMTVLANAAELAGEIDVDRAQKARDIAEQKMDALGPEEEDYASTEAALRRALNRIQVAGKAAQR